MTLLAGLVGSDGIVLAADKNFMEFSQSEKDLDSRLDGGKIVHLDKHNVVYAVAGDYIARAIGKKLKEMLDNHAFPFAHSVEMGQALEGIANQITQDEVSRTSNAGLLLIARRLLIVFYGAQVPEPQLWNLIANAHGDSGAEQVDGMAIAGARGNAARFFHHYFQYGLPVERLKLLAAHVILAGHRIDGVIDGLDVVTIKKSGFRRMAEPEKEPLRLLSAALDGMIRNFLLDTTIAPSIKSEHEKGT